MALKEQAAEMYDLITELIDCVDLLYTGLVSNNLKVVGEAEELLGRMDGRQVALTEALVREREKDPRAAPYVSVPSHIGRISGNIGLLAGKLKEKVKDGVLFSDRATGELEYLFERARDMLLHSKDMVLARNTLIARHIEESEKAVERAAQEYSTRHEERLIEGLCTPRASGIYLEMLDAFRGVAWHARDIAKDLS